MPRWPKKSEEAGGEDGTAVLDKRTATISDEDAWVLSRLITAPIHESEKARRAIQAWLEGLLQEPEVTGEQAKIALHVIQQSTVSKLSGLCNQVLAKYLSKFGEGD